MAHRKRWSWRWRRSIFSFLFVCTCWTLVGRRAMCKPLIDDQDSISDRLRRLESDEIDSSAMSTSDAIARLDQLRKTMETFKQLRLMLNERLLAGGAAKTEENFKFSGAMPSLDASVVDEAETIDDGRRRNFVLVAADDEDSDDARNHFLLKRADSDTDSPLPPKTRHRNHRDRQQQRRHRQRMRQMARNQRKEERRSDPDSERAMRDDGEAYPNPVQGFQITANVQQSGALRVAQKGQKQDSQRILAGLAKNDYECPKLQGKATQVLCPSRRRHGYRVCIPDTALCNGHLDCPNGEDEDPVNCLFYKTTIHHFRLIVDAVVELSDMVKRHEKRHNIDEL